MLSLLRIWVFLFAIAILIWWLLRAGGRHIAFYWVLLWVMVGSILMMAMLWGLSLLVDAIQYSV